MDSLISLFLIPTLSGYILLTKSPIHSIRTADYTFPKLAVESLVYGLVLLFLSYWLKEVYVYASGTLTDYDVVWSWIRWGWGKVFYPLTQEASSNQGDLFSISDPALFTLFLAGFYVMDRRYVQPWRRPKAFKTMQAREASQTGGEMQRLFHYASNNVELVQVTMRCGKVYVAFIKAPPKISTSSNRHNFLSILPILSGYRTQETKEIVFTTDYADPLRNARDDPALFEEVSRAMEHGIIIDKREILIASIWRMDIYERFQGED